ncbi:MAG TPA: glycosyltransferase family 39 protein [Patescibacteria group bacterium]|nr:glycosyltransferase family 39 protein [Patescibacteria group bacterium]
MKFKNFRISLSFLIIIVTAFVLRVFTLNKLMVFTPDEEYVLYITKTLTSNFHIIWIGVSALGFDFYMGPGLNYFLVPFMWLFNGNPFVWGLIACLFGVAACVLIYFFANKLFGRKTAIIASILYAVSALVVYYDQQPYPTAVPFLSMAMIISIYNTRHSKYWWIVFAFLYGIVFHIHLSMVLVVFVAIYWGITHKKTWNIKILVLSFLTFLTVISPLIVFNYFHNWSDFTAPIRVFQALGKNKNQTNMFIRIQTLTKATSRLFYLAPGKTNTDEILYPCNTLPNNNSTKASWIIICIALILLIIYFLKKDFWKNEAKRLIFVFSLAYLIPFIFLSSVGSVEYYLLGFFPIFFIIVAYTIANLNRLFRYVFYFLILCFVIFNVFTIFSASGEFGLATKRKMISDVMQIVGNSSFSLQEMGGPCQGTAGWGYLFTIYGRAPEDNIADKQFSWLLPVGNLENTKYKVVINESRFAIDETGYKNIIREGGFTAYIFKN